MNWPLATLLLTMWIVLLFFVFCLYVYTKEYKREEEYLKKLDEDLMKPLPIVYLTEDKSKKTSVLDNTTLPNVRNKSKKNIN